MNTSCDDRPALAGDELLAFGPFRLNRTQRALLKDGKAVRVGSRAFEILLALTKRPGTIVSKRELLGRVWSDTIVEEGTLRVHVAQLRKVLRGGATGTDYIQNVTGRGYCFVGSIVRQHALDASNPVDSSPPAPVSNLPRPLPAVFGRTPAEKVPEQHSVTIAGPGGGDNTTVVRGAPAH
jgi:DNA-binding winged helix-turn-helix (wHTH) protein